ncbi:MAG: hypothetical protein KBT29_05935 [Prevotellaceae bacterium]|nr:hypothetical protein [Candidatus Minthosoma caballi]
MKKLFTLATALITFLSVSAQAPANWKVGDDVAAELGLGDCSGAFEFSGTATPNDYGASDVKDFGTYWKGDLHPNEYGGIDEVHMLGYYNADCFDIYQVVKIPAGQYTLKVQSHYREGTPANSFVSYFNGTPKKNAFFYASVLPDNNPNSEPVRSIEKAICSIASSGITEQLYTNPDVSWQNDARSAKQVGADGNDVYYYAPCCVKGVATYFAAGCYWNEFNMVLVEDAYVRIGLKKIAKISEDSFPFGNLQVIYQGEAGEAAQLESAKEDCRKSLSELEKYWADMDAAGFEGLAGNISDLLMGFNDAIDDANSVAEVDAVSAEITKTTAGYTDIYKTAKELDELMQFAKDLMVSSDFPGKAAYTAAVDKAVADAKTSDVDKLGDDPSVYFKGIYNELSTARADYLNSQEPDEKGAKDFSGLIKNPWFVNAEYTPTQNEDGTWTLKEGGWADWGSISGQFGSPKNYADIDISAREGLEDICSKVVLSGDDKVTNQWYKLLVKQSGWSAGVQLMYQGGLVGVSQGWCDGFDGYEGVAQQLVGLPNGYYSLKGLVRGEGTSANITWNDDKVPPYHNIFAQNSEEVCVRSMVGRTDKYYSPAYGWYEWNPNVWQEHETSIIAINDGKLLIGGQSSMISNFTGFRLYFYGEQLDFTAKLQEYLDKIAPELEELSFEGDKKTVKAILDQIKLPIADKDAYEVAFGYYNEAKRELDAALAGEKSYTAANTFSELLDKYEFVMPAFVYASNFGSNESDTYESVAELNATAAAYSDYCEVYDKAVALNDAVVNEIIKKQTAELSAEMKSKETIYKYLDNLAVPYNVAVLASLGAAEATEAAPADVTSLLINPSFSEGPTKGWTGETPTDNEFAFNSEGKKTNAELWNKGAFTLSQKLVGLPAGTYELRVKAIYRDGTSVTQELVDAYNAAGNEENWANHNAQIFAKASDENDQFSYIKAIESIKATETSFRSVGTAWDYEEDAEGNETWFPTKITAIEGEPEDVQTADYTFVAEGAYPMDTKVGDYYYAASMQGFYQWCVKYPEQITNSVKITIATGDELEVGIRKTAAISQDWVIFDDFELLYLSGDTFKEVVTGVSEVKTATSNGVIYNVAGQRLNSLQKGINIVDGKKIYVK